MSPRSAQDPSALISNSLPAICWKAAKPGRVRGGGQVRTFTDSDHVAARPSSTEAEQSIEGDCVFAGFGIVSPEHKRDDYA